MKKIDLGQIITILANLAVVVGIVFLAIEVNQNQQAIEEQNSLNRAAIRGESGEAYNGWRAMLLENSHLIPIWDKGTADDALTPEEEAQFSRLCAYRIWMQLNLVIRMDLFGFAEESAGTTISLSNEIRQSDSIRRCWDTAKNGLRGRGYDDLADLVDSMVRDQ